MKKILVLISSLFLISGMVALNAGSKGKGEKCHSDIECSFGLTCNGGVCVKKKEFDFGSSGKTGKPCNSDADCIGSGKCERGSFGKSYCTGN